MKCKVFRIQLAEETRNLGELEFNKFLEGVEVSQTFASVIGDKFWSILVFYNDLSTPKLSSEKKLDAGVSLQPDVAGPEIKSEKTAPDPIILDLREEEIFIALREWRNDRANQDGIPPYMIAHNDSLMQIAKLGPKTKEDLVQVKGFGEKRAEKYGDEILEVLGKFE